MGPSNEALVRLFVADQKYRQAQARYDAAARNVRIQERKLSELTIKLTAASTALKELQSRTANVELDIKSREGHIEKLRVQQQTAKNNKEYQTFLIQINTEKVDKGKAEDELLGLMGEVEKMQQEASQLTNQVETETQNLEAMRHQITDKLETIQKEVESLKPARDAAAANVSANVLEQFDRLADRFEGEAVAEIQKPDRRQEEYICGACNMSLAPDIYNRLHSRDEAVLCPNCRRFLYIPEDLTLIEAIKQPKKKVVSKKTGEAKTESADTPTQA